MEKFNKENLEKLILIENKSYSAIGRMYGVSGNAIKKKAKYLGIPIPQRRVIDINENFSHPKYKSNSYVNIVNDKDFVDIIAKSFGWNEIAINLGYKSNNVASNVKNAIIMRCNKLNIKLNLRQQESLLDKTKGELFKYRKNWQSARSAIRKIAYRIYYEENPSPKCVVCGYDHHVEVAHKKAVSDFDDSATIAEINDINNLIGLCPNHHWEFDNGMLEI